MYQILTNTKNLNMGKIIVGFDFSTGSAKAVDLTIDIANGWQYDIKLVYVKNKDEDETPIREEIERRNAAVAPLLRNIKLDYSIRQGNATQELIRQADEDEAALIVVGTKGMSGERKKLIGGTAYSTIAESPYPVLNVREEFNFNKKLENILVPIDSTPATRQKVPFACKFAQVFGSSITLLGLYTSDSDGTHLSVNNYMAQSAKYLAKMGVDHSTKYLDASKNLTTTTLNYANEIHADLIFIMTEQEETISNLLLGSFAQQMLNHSSIPLLTIRPEEIGINSRWS